MRGQILLSEKTYQMAPEFIEIGDINEVKVKGKKGAVRMYELLATQRPTPLVAPAREIRNSSRVEVDMPLAFQLLSGKIVLPVSLLGSSLSEIYGKVLRVSVVPEGFECRVEFTFIDSGAALVFKEFVDGIVETHRHN